MRILVAFGLSLVLATLEFASSATAQDATRPPGIVGEDNRAPIRSREWPWSSIGRLNRSTGGFCTGVLIGPKQVLTVAHCLYDTRLGRWTGATWSVELVRANVNEGARISVIGAIQDDRIALASMGSGQS